MKCHLGIKVPREKHRLKVFVKRVPHRIFGSQEGGSGRRLEKVAL
jgi:hypothetical protein